MTPWGIGDEERHRAELSVGDMALVYVASAGSLIGRAQVATAVHGWTKSESDAYPGDALSGVLLSDVEEWDPAVPMDAVVQRIDPMGSNPIVQENAAAGFRMGLVLLTESEYEAAVAVSQEPRPT